ncbi:uncharacterized protein M421DRAFT_121091 [Didymella exigua CBS 183.55]|uniref:Uncharacterized protein n=1 Tax=Didymella exigua CBS 183.55 TaxID=1150837 RepID=A0A6A5SAD3_9PLEO|nr:uncharacterized protein M421DRAFT_121091 [Didymella exigua CBS 183.55]KAF1934437.1 hypothetical protein M421DRAFT_121091 [Didymella exigua CBS 183.55]
MATNTCGCTLSVLHTLMRVEQFGTGTLDLPKSLELLEDAELRCRVLLNCATCRTRRFSLSSVTVVCITIVDWVRKEWFPDDLINGCTDHIVSLGPYELDPADTEILSRELMSLQLSHFSDVVDLLQSALSNMKSIPTERCFSLVFAQLRQLQELARRNSLLSVPAMSGVATSDFI